jgi:mono/diheme cytochrome c family protein
MASRYGEAICVKIDFMNWRFSFFHFLRSRRFGCLAITMGLLLLLFASALPQPGRVVAQPKTQLVLIPTPFSNPTATPPSQGGHGHDLFYIYCMSCHGDVGQGLTDEFRLREYPPEDTNCWKSGCHGERPYENGFTLPKTVPALIGPNTLTKFATARNMFDFMHIAMPFNKPGSLSQEQYLQILAYLLEQNHLVPAGVQLDPDSLQQIVLRPEQAPTPSVVAAAAPIDNSSSILIVVGIFLGVVVVAIAIMRRRSGQAPH